MNKQNGQVMGPSKDEMGIPKSCMYNLYMPSLSRALGRIPGDRRPIFWAWQCLTRQTQPRLLAQITGTKSSTLVRSGVGVSIFVP